MGRTKQIFFPKKAPSQQINEEMLNIPTHQGNANQNCNEITFQIS